MPMSMRRAVTWIGPRPGVKVDVTAKRTFLGATMDFITMDVSCTWITTRDRALEGAANITLISTLLLTMETVTSGGNVGDALAAGGVSTATVEGVYSSISYVSMFMFVMATFMGVSMTIFIRMLADPYTDSADEPFVAFVAENKYLFKLLLMHFFGGFFCYLFNLTWQFCSLMGWISAIIVSPMMLIFAATFCIVIHGYQTVHNVNLAAQDRLQQPESLSRTAGTRGSSNQDESRT